MSFQDTPTTCGEETSPEAESEEKMVHDKSNLDNKSHEYTQL